MRKSDDDMFCGIASNGNCGCSGMDERINVWKEVKE